ncbi:MAG: hypothetical protein IJ466_02320 [Clostridia bacterium]|nr:hypothetical protein [Clostridia bacterium]
MRTELARMRDLLRAALPERAFLRRDRGDALFITNLPPLQAIPGFTLEARGGMTCILPEKCWMEELEARHPEAPDSLCGSLARFRGEAPGDDALRLFARGLKLLDMENAPSNEIEAFDRALRQHAAIALRGGGCGGLYALAILNYEISKGE